MQPAVSLFESTVKMDTGKKSTETIFRNHNFRPKEKPEDSRQSTLLAKLSQQIATTDEE